MPIYSRKTLLLAKLEDVYGVDPNPTVAEDQIEIFDFSITPNIDKIDREPYRPSMSPVASLPSKRYTELSFYVEVKGAGIDDATGSIKEPKVVRLLQACGFNISYLVSVKGESVGTGDGTTTTFTLSNTPVAVKTLVVYIDGNVTTDYTVDYITGTITFNSAPASGAVITADYKYETDTIPSVLGGYKLQPTSTDFKSLTFYAYLDGVLYKVHGARGNVQIQLEANNVGKFNFSFTGLFVQPIDEPFPDVSCDSDELTPPLVKNVGLTMGGYAPILSSFEVDMQNDIVQRDDMNAVEGVGGVEIIGRKPQGSMNPDMMLASEYPIWDKFVNNEPQSIEGTVGSQEGNSVTIYIPKAVYSSIGIGDRDSVRVYDVNFSTIGCDDEVQIYFK